MEHFVGGSVKVKLFILLQRLSLIIPDLFLLLFLRNHLYFILLYRYYFLFGFLLFFL